MEVLKVITRSRGGFNYINKATNYVLDERCAASKGYGLDPKNASSVKAGFKGNSSFWRNEDKNPLLHNMYMFTKETAPTPEDAIRLVDEISKPYTKDHLALSVGHEADRDCALNHVHQLIGTTNYVDGSMLYADDSTAFDLAQRTADATGQPVELETESNDGKKWKCPRIFLPKKDDEE